MPEQPTLTPDQFVSNIQRALPRLSETELANLKKQARAWATVFYSVVDREDSHAGT